MFGYCYLRLFLSTSFLLSVAPLCASLSSVPPLHRPFSPFNHPTPPPSPSFRVLSLFLYVSLNPPSPPICRHAPSLSPLVLFHLPTACLPFPHSLLPSFFFSPSPLSLSSVLFFFVFSLYF